MLDVILFFTVVGVVVGAIVLWRIDTMRQSLTDAISALTAEVEDSTGKLASIEAFVKGVPDLVGAAVGDALAAHDVEEDEAAASIDAARQAMSDRVDETLEAIAANPAPEEVGDPAPPEADQPEE